VKENKKALLSAYQSQKRALHNYWRHSSTDNNICNSGHFPNRIDGLMLFVCWAFGVRFNLVAFSNK
jgi:hypothetical protein